MSDSPYGAPPPPPPPPPLPPGDSGAGSYPDGPAGPGGFGQPAGNKGFFGALFDFSFETFVTPIIVKVAYVLALVVLVLVWLVFIIGGFTESAGLGVLCLLGGAVAVVFYLALIRMTLEFYYALVRMSQDIHERLPRA